MRMVFVPSAAAVSLSAPLLPRAAFDWVVAERLIHHADPFPFIIVNGAKQQQQQDRVECVCVWDDDGDASLCCSVRLLLLLDEAALFSIFSLLFSPFTPQFLLSSTDPRKHTNASTN